MFSLDLKGDYKSISQIQTKEEESLLAKNNVVAVGISHKEEHGEDTGEPCLTCFVQAKLEPGLLSKDDMIPKRIGKCKTDVVEVGQIFAQSDVTLRKRIRPAMGGYSVGHTKITAGTLGTCVIDSTPVTGEYRRVYILSNNHVLANSNAAVVGDPILQPGPFDGGTLPNDLIARLSRWVPINFLPSRRVNYVDAAIAEGDLDDLNREIYWKGYVKDMVPPAVGMKVTKTGRTTGHTTGIIRAINATVDVNYGAAGVARFSRQIITTDMSAGGDSGSLVMDMNNTAVGLLFAGSSTVTICNDIRYVMALLRIKFL
ncbi:MAG: serine protease [Bacteroidota bacterium]